MGLVLRVISLSLALNPFQLDIPEHVDPPPGSLKRAYFE
jgi:hypothetical protein